MLSSSIYDVGHMTKAVMIYIAETLHRYCMKALEMWILSLISFSFKLQSFYFYFSGELSPALPPKRKSTVVSSPADSATPPPPPYPTRNSGGLPTNGAVNGAGVGDASVPEPSVGEDNVPALPPKKSVSRMSTDLNELPVAEKPKVGTSSSYKLCLSYLQ